jgi:hypothetical protein
MIHNDATTLRQQPLRGTDSNTLLRLYDEAKGLLATSPLQRDREWAERATRRISAELRKRKVRVI